MTTRTYFI